MVLKTLWIILHQFGTRLNCLVDEARDALRYDVQHLGLEERLGAVEVLRAQGDLRVQCLNALCKCSV